MTCVMDCGNCIYAVKVKATKGYCKVNHSITCAGNCDYCHFYVGTEYAYTCGYDDRNTRRITKYDASKRVR